MSTATGGPESAAVQALLSAVPEDPFAAFVLADYLEERDDPQQRLRGELLRLVYTLTRSVGGEGRAGREGRLRTLLAEGARPVGPYRRVELGGEVVMEFVWVPPGVFLMGSPDDEEGRVTEEREGQDPEFSFRIGEWEEGPRHEVGLRRGFWMGTAPVTQIQYARAMGHNPSWNSSRDADVEEENRELPVQEVTWYDANAFLRTLSRQAGGHFRLPTEAEWEYACRGGTMTRFWSGDADADLGRVGWYYDNTTDSYPKMRPVGRKPANGFGLGDMHGNVWEWCLDRFDPHYYTRSPGHDPRCVRGEDNGRVIRGGGAWQDPRSCRAATRRSNAADCSHNDISFRVVADKL